MAKKSIFECKIDFQKALGNNIIFASGNTLLKNFCGRARKEISKILPE